MTERHSWTRTREEIDNIYESGLEGITSAAEKALLILQSNTKDLDLKKAALLVRSREAIKQNPLRASRPTSLWHLTSVYT